MNSKAQRNKKKSTIEKKSYKKPEGTQICPKCKEKMYNCTYLMNIDHEFCDNCDIGWTARMGFRFPDKKLTSLGWKFTPGP